MSDANKKSALINFLQRHIGRTLTKSDVTYATTEADGMFESCLLLRCLNDESFKGAIGSSEKEAEQNAAHIALEAYALDIANLPPKTGESRAKRSGTRKPSMMKPLVMATNSKTGLVQFLQKFVGRTMTAADTEYSVVEVSGHYQATLVLRCLHAECYVGQPSPDARQAEQSAAQMALDTHSAEVRLLSTQVAGTPPSLAAGKKGARKPLFAIPQKRGALTPPPFTPGKNVLAGQQRPGSAVQKQRKRAGPGQAGNEDAANSKTKLICFLQAHIGRTLTKDDVSYISSTVGAPTASVRLNCLDGQEFHGGKGVDERSAQHAAASIALQVFADEVAAWEAMPPKDKRPRK